MISLWLAAARLIHTLTSLKLHSHIQPVAWTALSDAIDGPSLKELDIWATELKQGLHSSWLRPLLMTDIFHSGPVPIHQSRDAHSARFVEQVLRHMFCIHACYSYYHLLSSPGGAPPYITRRPHRGLSFERGRPGSSEGHRHSPCSASLLSSPSH